MTKALLSIVIVSYNNERELPRTLWSLSPHFQVGVCADDYEVIVVDNGSKRPPKLRDFADYGLDLKIVSMENPTHSPVKAVNHGIALSCGEYVAVMIDGARMVSPGVLRTAREALDLHPRAVVGTRGRYIGPLLQRFSMRFGYDQKMEDQLLDSIDWKNNGYDLFDVSLFDEPSRPTWFAQIGESNALFMRRTMWAELGGFDERFETPGGGFVNLDTWERACELPDSKVVILLGEATFHQFHGGVATNKPQSAVVPLREEYIALHGRDHKRTRVPATFYGAFVKTPIVDEVYWHADQVATDLMADGPMKGLLDMSMKPMSVTRDGTVVTPEVRAARAAEKGGGKKPGAGKGGGAKSGAKAGAGKGTGKKANAGKVFAPAQDAPAGSPTGGGGRAVGLMASAPKVSPLEKPGNKTAKKAGSKAASTAGGGKKAGAGKKAGGTGNRAGGTASGPATGGKKAAGKTTRASGAGSSAKKAAAPAPSTLGRVKRGVSRRLPDSVKASIKKLT